MEPCNDKQAQNEERKNETLNFDRGAFSAESTQKSVTSASSKLVFDEADDDDIFDFSPSL